jgi:hypothetical protein
MVEHGSQIAGEELRGVGAGPAFRLPVAPAIIDQDFEVLANIVHDTEPDARIERERVDQYKPRLA